MKNLLLILTFGSLLLTSCEETLLSNDPRDKIVGQWSCTETSYLKSGSVEEYGVYIEKDEADSSIIYISNFYDLGNESEAKATYENNVITLIANQEFATGFTLVSGSGLVNASKDRIEFTYGVDDGSGFTDEAEAIYEKLD